MNMHCFINSNSKDFKFTFKFSILKFNVYVLFSEMSGVQGIIVCGEASESEEEEEFCLSAAREQKGNILIEERR